MQESELGGVSLCLQQDSSHVMRLTLSCHELDFGSCRNLSLVAPPAAEAHAGLTSTPSRGLSDGLPPSPTTHSPVYRRPDWLLCNDFCIMPCAAAEVVTLFGNQKIPCLLYYSRVSPLSIGTVALHWPIAPHCLNAMPASCNRLLPVR